MASGQPIAVAYEPEAEAVAAEERWAEPVPSAAISAPPMAVPASLPEVALPVAMPPVEPATMPAAPAAAAKAAAVPAAVAPIVVAPYVLPTDALDAIARDAGLQWVNSDADKIRAVREAMANEPKPIHVPRQPKPRAVIDEGPLVLVETKKDLSQIRLPFDPSPPPAN